MPEAVESPAPVSTTTRRAWRHASASARGVLIQLRDRPARRPRSRAGTPPRDRGRRGPGSAPCAGCLLPPNSDQLRHNPMIYSGGIAVAPNGEWGEIARRWYQAGISSRLARRARTTVPSDSSRVATRASSATTVTTAEVAPSSTSGSRDLGGEAGVGLLLCIERLPAVLWGC